MTARPRTAYHGDSSSICAECGDPVRHLSRYACAPHVCAECGAMDERVLASACYPVAAMDERVPAATALGRAMRVTRAAPSKGVGRGSAMEDTSWVVMQQACTPCHVCIAARIASATSRHRDARPLLLAQARRPPRPRRRPGGSSLVARQPQGIVPTMASSVPAGQSSRRRHRIGPDVKQPRVRLHVANRPRPRAKTASVPRQAAVETGSWAHRGHRAGHEPLQARSQLV